MRFFAVMPRGPPRRCAVIWNNWNDEELEHPKAKGIAVSKNDAIYDLALQIRRDSIRMVRNAGSGHLGGAMGAAFGFLLGSVIGNLIDLAVNPSISLGLFVVGFAMVTSILSGLYPAWRASNLNPVEALRHE